MYKPIESDMKYKNLYIKYKNKYLDIKNKLSAIEESEHMGGFKKQVGGMPPRPPRYNSIKDKMTKEEADKYVADITYVKRNKEVQNDSCGICLEKLSVGLPKVTECNHTFHAKCLSELNEKRIRNCPMCRSNLGNIYPDDESDNESLNGLDDDDAPFTVTTQIINDSDTITFIDFIEGDEYYGTLRINSINGEQRIVIVSGFIYDLEIDIDGSYTTQIIDYPIEATLTMEYTNIQHSITITGVDLVSSSFIGHFNTIENNNTRGVAVIAPTNSLTLHNDDMIAFTSQDDENEMIIYGRIQNIRVNDSITNNYIASNTWNELQNGFPFSAEIDEGNFYETPHTVTINGVNENRVIFYGEFQVHAELINFQSTGQQIPDLEW